MQQGNKCATLPGGGPRREQTPRDPVVLITGALAGIGRAAAKAFALDGARLVLSGRQEESGRLMADELRGFGGEVEFFSADVRHEDDVGALVAFAVERFGRLDVAVNSAGTEGRPGPLGEVSAEDYVQQFETNVLGSALCLKHQLTVMNAQGSGCIVNLSSTMGHKAAAGAALYAASKHAVEGLTKTAALEGAAFGVRVNAVAPGPIQTAMLDRFAGSAERKRALITGIPLKRAGRPEEIADAILFLASDRASFITGHILAVDGGKSIS